MADTWEKSLHDMFDEVDKDKSGELTRRDLLMMLLEADKKHAQKDPTFKMNLKFLTNCLKSADKNDDDKISFDEFKEFVSQASAASK